MLVIVCELYGMVCTEDCIAENQTLIICLCPVPYTCSYFLTLPVPSKTSQATQSIAHCGERPQTSQSGSSIQMHLEFLIRFKRRFSTQSLRERNGSVKGRKVDGFDAFRRGSKREGS